MKVKVALFLSFCAAVGIGIGGHAANAIINGVAVEKDPTIDQVTEQIPPTGQYSAVEQKAIDIAYSTNSFALPSDYAVVLRQMYTVCDVAKQAQTRVDAPVVVEALAVFYAQNRISHEAVAPIIIGARDSGLCDH